MTVFSLTIPIDDDLRQAIDSYLVSELGDDYHPDLIEVDNLAQTVTSKKINDLFCRCINADIKDTIPDNYNANYLHSLFHRSIHELLGHFIFPMGFEMVGIVVHNLIYLSPEVDLLTVEMEVIHNVVKCFIF